ncbi:MAG: hypothetical protein H8K07_01585 [Nitrospira sp.]|nr:hypothetical protein [Nitrospira sp.]
MLTTTEHMTQLQLRHYSDRLLTKLDARDQALGEMKPAGLWCSVGRAWEDWCRTEEFHLDGLQHVHEIVMRHEANLLHLRGTRAIDEFNARYGQSHSSIALIDWPRVASNYGGIIIDPYCWERRLTYLWYYSWDCASACIWDTGQVAEWRLIDAEVTR